MLSRFIRVISPLEKCPKRPEEVKLAPAVYLSNGVSRTRAHKCGRAQSLLWCIYKL